MAKEAGEIEAFLQGIEGQEALAKQTGDLAGRLEAAGILTIGNKVELPTGVRIETLTIGTMSKAAIEAEYKKRGIRRSYAQDLIDRIELSKESQDVKLAWSSGRDLGLTASSPYRAFLEAGQAKGYNVCDPEVGLYLRLQDTEQPLWDWYWVAMEPISDRYGDPRVFALEHYGHGL